MKTLMRWIVVIVVLTGSAVHAQNITGAWQGILNVGKELRIVVTIANAAQT